VFSSVFLAQSGQFLLALSLGLFLFSIFGSILGVKRSNPRLLESTRRAIYAGSALISISVVILWIAFLEDHFLLRYVYAYSNRDMPVIYKITALWGGQDGSLLFWLWIACLYSSACLFLHRRSDRTLIPYMVPIFGTILGFFASLILYSDNPFSVFPAAPLDGRGLNPLLQNPSMAIHPPSLYLGFVGMSVPFCFALAALLSGQLGNRWIVATRLWSLIAWFFLSIGNLLGAQWAYVELGWGGFWAWDPVENAAILPWFTSSAFLHSVMIQEKRGMLKFWNMHLIVLSFLLTILGTYLTRSGVVQSVHSFASSETGIFFLIFLCLSLLFSAFWIWRRRNELKSDNIFESFLSKESAFVVNNIVLVGSAFIILWSTLFPSASELIIGTRIVVGPPFFNKILAPFGIALLILTGIGPAIAWRKASPSNLKRNFIAPILVGCLALIFVALLELWQWYVLATAFGVGFVVTTIVMEFYRGAKARMHSYRESPLVALVRISLKNHRKYGGYIVHLGIVFIFIGIAGAVYKDVFEFDLRPGQTAQFKEYEIQFQGIRQIDKPNQIETFADIDLFVRGEKKLQVKPARFFYKSQEQPSTEVDIYSRWKEDVYFILGGIHPDDGSVRIRVLLQPFISWLWLGGLILIFGGLISMLPSLSRRTW
jgi:cytochrome c-type biogenesis protein CcmF